MATLEYHLSPAILGATVEPDGIVECARRPARIVWPDRLIRPVTLLSALVGLAIGLGALLPPASAAGNLSAVRASQDRVDAYVNERMAAWSIPGLALAIVELP